MIYISDLDGTLLGDDEKLSQFTIDTINKIYNKDIIFTIATARSLYSAKEYIMQLDLKYPCILRNGTVIYDPIKKQFISKKTIDYELATELINDLIAFNFNPIVHYSINNNEFVDYRNMNNLGEKQYIKARLKTLDKRLKKVKEYTYNENYSFISISSIQKNNEKELSILKEKYKNRCLIHSYKDNYSNFSWLEINNAYADKKTGCEFLLKYFNEKQYIAFGDGLNDVAMLQNAYEGYIPNNSHLYQHGYDFKLVDNNNNDGVAKFLNELV